MIRTFHVTAKRIQHLSDMLTFTSDDVLMASRDQYLCFSQQEI